MLFHHAVLTCSSYKGTSGAFELSSAARSQVSYAIQHTHVEHKLYKRARLMCIISHVLLHADALCMLYNHDGLVWPSAQLHVAVCTCDKAYWT